jgi:hypothetical protein
MTTTAGRGAATPSGPRLAWADVDFGQLDADGRIPLIAGFIGIVP